MTTTKNITEPLTRYVGEFIAMYNMSGSAAVNLTAAAVSAAVSTYNETLLATASPNGAMADAQDTAVRVIDAYRNRLRRSESRNRAVARAEVLALFRGV